MMTPLEAMRAIAEFIPDREKPDPYKQIAVFSKHTSYQVLKDFGSAQDADLEKLLDGLRQLANDLTRSGTYLEHIGTVQRAFCLLSTPTQALDAEGER